MTTNNTNATTTTKFPKHVPDLKEGQNVRVLSPALGMRVPTADERDAWYEKFNADCKAGIRPMVDGFGDVFRAPCSIDKEFGPGKSLTVVQAEAFPRSVGINTNPSEKHCVVLDSDTNEKWIMARRFLETAA
jgi:hypothetical protein